jgi:hypothetical protein
MLKSMVVSKQETGSAGYLACPPLASLAIIANLVRRHAPVAGYSRLKILDIGETSPERVLRTLAVIPIGLSLM